MQSLPLGFRGCLGAASSKWADLARLGSNLNETIERSFVMLRHVARNVDRTMPNSTMASSLARRTGYPAAHGRAGVLARILAA